MTPATIAHCVAAECGSLNDTERERARLLAIEHQMAAIAESFSRADSCRAGKRTSEGAKLVLEALERYPEMTKRDLVERLGVSRDAVRTAERHWGKQIKTRKRTAPKIEHMMAELRRSPESMEKTNTELARLFSVSWLTVRRAKERIENENLTKHESVSQ